MHEKQHTLVLQRKHRLWSDTIWVCNLAIPFIAVASLGSYLTSLNCLSFLIYKIGIIIVPRSWSCYVNQIIYQSFSIVPAHRRINICAF